ncbi:ATP-grasp domain-containing protein [Priestia megaterium]|uniref:ATP-grasp domain-containing protein n=1 Tax=Priestia megaterium TaxID=1404 RepID=UPI003393C03F
MSNSVALLIETPRTGAGIDFVKACKELDIKPIILISSPESQPKWVMDDYYKNGIEIKKVNTYNYEELLSFVKRMQENYKIKAILSLYEYSTYIAAKLAKELNLKSPNPEIVNILRDKSKFRSLVSKLKVDNTDFKVLSNGDLADYHLNYPVVVKPVNLTGSAFVRLCKDSQSLQEALKEIKGIGQYTGQTVAKDVLIEEFIDGEEYSVEIMNGSIIAIIRKHTTSPGFIEVQHELPANISDEKIKRINNYIYDFLDLIDYKFGLMHLEIKLDKNDIHFIEANPRVAGGRIPELIRQVYGYDIILEYLKSLVEKGEPAPLNITGKKAVIKFFVAKKNGILNQYPDFKLNNFPNVLEVKFYKNLGEHFTINFSNKDRILHVMAIGESIDAVINTINDFYESINLEECIK